MHAYLTGTDVEQTETGLRITMQSTMGNFTFEASEVLVQSLIDDLIDTMYSDTIENIELTESGEYEQLNFGWSGYDE